MSVCGVGATRAAAARPTLRRGQLWISRCSSPRPSPSASPSASTRQRRSTCRLRPLLAAAGGSPAEEAAWKDAAGELPLWRFLRQQGFSADGISHMQGATRKRSRQDGTNMNQVPGVKFTEQKLQSGLAPAIAALRAEGLDTATIGLLFQQFPALLTTTHATFSSSLAALRQLAALLPDDPRTVQAPPGATQLGVALWLYPTAAASLLTRANLASLIDGNLQLRRQLGISDAATAAAVFRQHSALVANFERAEAMVAHLQRLQASGELSAEQVTALALSGALSLTPAEFDRRWQTGGLQQAGRGAIKCISLKDPAGRQRAAAEALGELLQAADGIPGPLQQQYQQQGEALVQRCGALWRAGPAAVRASWASLQQLGLSSSQVAAVVHAQPAALSYNWEGEAKQRLLAWVQQELGLSPQDFLLRHPHYSTYSVATIAMRADYLRLHRPAVWQECLARGSGSLLSLLTHRTFLARAGCTEAELAAFNRAWLATPAGRRWGVKASRRRRQAKQLAE